MIPKTLVVLPRAVVLALCAAAGCAPSAPPAPVQQMLSDAGVSDSIEFIEDASTAAAIDVGEDSPTSLDVAHAVRRALAVDPDLQSALARVRAAQADAWETRLLPNPVLSVAVRFPETGGSPVIEAGLAAELLDLLRRPARISAADHRLRAACAEAVTRALDLIAEVEERHVSAAAAEQSVDVMEERFSSVVRQRDLAAKRLEHGEATRYDVATLDAQRVELETEIAERRLEAVEERLALARLIGEPSSDAAWQLEASPGGPSIHSPEDVWIETALRRRPELQALQWRLAALGIEARDVGWSTFEGAEVGVDAEREGDWTVGPAVSTPLPLLDWGQARRAQIAAERAEAMHELTAQRRKVVEEVRRAYASLRASAETADRVRGELVPLQRARREQADAAYREGEADITALLLADNDLQEARARAVELDRKAALALIRLRRAVGGPAPAAEAGGAATTIPSTLPATVPPADASQGETQ